MSIPTRTRKLLRQDMLREIYREHDIVVSNATSTGSTTALNDTALSPAAESEEFRRAYIQISGAATGTSGPAIGEVSRVIDVDFSSGTSQLSLLPALSAAPANGQEYEIHYDLHPSKWDELMDEYLDETLHPIILPATVVTDGDMRTSGVGNWTDSNATSTKSTSFSYFGSQSLRVTASADDGYTQSNSFEAKGNDVMLVDALAYITAGDSAKLILYDVTNSATVDTAESAATGWVRFRFTATVPATCEQMAVRLESQTNTDVIYWDYVIVWPQSKLDIVLPTSIEYGNEIDMVTYWPLGSGLSSTTDDNAYVVSGSELEFYSHHHDNFDPTRPQGSTPFDSTPYRLHLARRENEARDRVTQPLFLKAWVDYATFTDDTTTTTVNKDVFKHTVIAEILDVLALKAEKAGNHEMSIALSGRAELARSEVADLLRDEGPQPRGVIQGAFRR